MADREKVIQGLEVCLLDEGCSPCPYFRRGNDYFCGVTDIMRDALSLLKEQEAVVKQWTKEIADNQLAHAPKDSYEFMSLDEHLENEYKRGIWDGLQIAWNIISEGR